MSASRCTVALWCTTMQKAFQSLSRRLLSRPQLARQLRANPVNGPFQHCSFSSQQESSSSSDESETQPLLVVGSACVDCFIDVERLPLRGETLASPNTRTGTLLPGGKGANQAAAAASFGAQTFFNGRFGDDDDANTISATMQGFGVDISLSQRDPTCPSGKAFIFLEPTGDNSIIIVQGTNIEGWTEENLKTDAFEQRLKEAGAVMLQREIPDFINLEVAKMATEHNVPVLLDVGGTDAPLDPQLAPYITICWPNETELMNISGGLPTDNEQQIAEVYFFVVNFVFSLLQGLGFRN